MRKIKSRRNHFCDNPLKLTRVASILCGSYLIASLLNQIGTFECLFLKIAHKLIVILEFGRETF